VGESFEDEEVERALKIVFGHVIPLVNFVLRTIGIDG
jgi:hypothetical protein